MTPREIFDTELPAKIGEDVVKANKIGAVYKFVISGDDGGTWCVDLNKGADWVTEGEGDADCTVKVKDSDFVKMFEGKLPGPQAFMMGKLKIEGDMGLAMKLGKVIG